MSLDGLIFVLSRKKGAKSDFSAAIHICGCLGRDRVRNRNSIDDSGRPRFSFGFRDRRHRVGLYEGSVSLLGYVSGCLDLLLYRRISKS